MGTSYHVTVVDPTRQHDPRSIQSLIEQQLLASNQTFSTYIDDSELSLLNQAPVGQPIIVTKPLWEVLTLSVELAQLSDGAFDITVKPLVDLWGFGPNPGADQPPADQQITAILATIGYQHLLLDHKHHTVVKKSPVTLDLSGIAKGYAVDQLAQILYAQGIENFMVEIGGELYLAGHSPRDTPWRIAIEEPTNPISHPHRVIHLSDNSVATSGDYRNYFEYQNRRYSHTIDPRTGYPVQHNLVSVTVIDHTSARADALATAISVLGTEAGLQLAEQYDLAVYLISHSPVDGQLEVYYSTAFKPYL